MRLRIQVAFAAITILIGGVPTLSAAVTARQLVQDTGSKPIIVAAGIVEITLFLLLVFGLFLAAVTFVEVLGQRKRNSS